MSVRSYIYIFVSVLVLVVLSFFTGRWTYNCPPLPVPEDSVYITQPSIVTKATASKHTIVFAEQKPIEDDEFLSAVFDTIITETGTGDTLAVSKTTVKVRKKDDVFSALQEIEIKKYETTVHDTVKTIKYVPKLIPVEHDDGVFGSFEGGVLITIVAELIILLATSL